MIPDPVLAFSASKYPPGIGLEHSCQLPFGFIYQPFLESNSEASIPSPVLCIHCLGHANLYCETTSIDEKYTKWKCSICEGINVAKKESIEPALVTPSISFTQQFSNADRKLPLLILVVDANMKEEARKIHKALPQTNDFEVALIVFNEKAKIYHLGVAGMAAADVLDEIPTNHNYLGTGSTKSLQYCLSAVFGLEEEAQNLSRLERLKLRKQQRLASNRKPEQRDTAQAIHKALDLAAQQNRPDTRIWLFTNGYPNCGEAFVNEDLIPIEYYKLLGEEAAESHVLIDVICSGHKALHIPIYTALVEPSHGYVITNEALDNLDLVHLWENRPAAVDLLPNMDEYNGALLDIRTSSFMDPSHLVGPASIIENEDVLVNEEKAFEHALARAENHKISTKNLPDMMNTLTRARIGRFDPLMALSVMLQVNDFFQKQPFAVVQCTVRFTKGNSLVTRVVTQRLAIAKDVSAFIDSVDEQVMPILLGKEAVARSLYGYEEVGDDAVIRTDKLEARSRAVQSDIDTTVLRISSAFRLLGLEHGTRARDLTEEGGIRAAGSSMDFAFPPEFRGSLRSLYLLRRSTLLSPDPLQSADDRIALRHLYLRLPIKDCLQMMSPSLWTTGLVTSEQDVSIEPAPPETMALWDRSIVVSDCFWQLFVWSGKEVKDEKFDGIRDQMRSFIRERTKDRFPAPELYVVTEGDSMSRRFTAILSPSHADPIEHQVTNFPALSTLSSDQLTDLREKFKFHDTSADASFREWFWNVVSAVNAKASLGKSLCE